MNTLELLVEITKELTEIEQINVKETLLSQLDSIDLARLIIDIEDRFWLDLDDSVVHEYNTLEKLAQFIDGELFNQIV